MTPYRGPRVDRRMSNSGVRPGREGVGVKVTCVALFAVLRRPLSLVSVRSCVAHRATVSAVLRAARLVLSLRICFRF